MRSPAQLLLGLILLPGAILAGGSRAAAHPHIWVTITSQLIYLPDGTLTGVRHAWTFDDKYSSHAMQGIETKGVYTHEDLASLTQVTMEWLKENGYFTSLRAANVKQTFEDPADTSSTTRTTSSRCI
jgi:ABC-type uncharacterized transport system substrate-binding protein